MIDPNDPKQAKDYYFSGIAFIICVVLILFLLVSLSTYIYVNKLY